MTTSINPATIKNCDNTSVGIVVQKNGKFLLLTRGTFPAGVAPAAGHGDLSDEHATLQQTARDEIKEELGLTAINLSDPLINGEQRENRCRRPGGDHHVWTVFQAEVSGELNPSLRETKGAQWYTKAELQRLANRTSEYSQGLIREGQWQKSPGLEPVWVKFFNDLGIIRMKDAQLQLIDAVAKTGQAPTMPIDLTTGSSANRLR